MKRLSIIVPMYNSFHMMKKNLEILSKQKECEIELVVVDDCSVDDSFLCAKEYAGKSSFDMIVVQNKVNGGPGSSRNNGILQATGDYIMFVDSDDYLVEDFTKSIAPILEMDVDCIIFDYYNVNLDGKILSNEKSIRGNCISEGFNETRTLLVYASGSTCGKIYRRELIVQNNIKFAELFRNEDMPFTKHAIAVSRRGFYCPLPLYCYVQNADSLMHNEQLLDESNAQKAFEILKRNLIELDLKEELLVMELREVLNNTVMIKAEKKETREKIIQYIRDNYSKWHIRNRYFANQPFYVKVISYCAYYRCIVALKMICKYRQWKKRKKG